MHRVPDEVFFIFIIIISANTEPRSFTEDYIWRDYEGVVPSDALANGFDKNGKTVYIGQVLYEDKLIPGKIIENDDKIYFEWYDNEKSTTKNVKIFCTSFSHKFEWINSRHNEVTQLTNKIVIKGGYEPNFNTYIGRVFEDGETKVGKVICSNTDCFGLYTTNNGKTKLHQAFAILTYNPNVGDVVLDK